MDFKVTYLDAGLTSSYISDNESVHGGSNGTVAPTGTGSTPTPVTPSTKIGKRYKTHLRDFLSSCRSNNKRKNSTNSADLYHDSTSAAAASAYASVYSQSGAAAAAAAAASHPYDSTNPLYMQQNIAAAAAASAAPYQSIYSPVDNHRYFPPEYLASYRSLTATYYPEYAASAHAAQYIGNSYFDASRPTAAALSSIQYDASQLKYFEDKSNSECKYSSYDTGKQDLRNTWL